MDVAARYLHHLIAFLEFLLADGAFGFRMRFLAVFFGWELIQIALLYALVHLPESGEQRFVQELLGGIDQATPEHQAASLEAILGTISHLTVCCGHPRLQQGSQQVRIQASVPIPISVAIRIVRPQQGFQQVWIQASIPIPIAISIPPSVSIPIFHQVDQLLHAIHIELSLTVIALTAALMHLEQVHWKLAIAVGAFHHQLLAGSDVLVYAGKGYILAACWAWDGFLLARLRFFGFLLLLWLGCRGFGFWLGVLSFTGQPMLDVAFFLDHLVAAITKNGPRLLVAGLNPHPPNKYQYNLYTNRQASSQIDQKATAYSYGLFNFPRKMGQFRLKQKVGKGSFIWIDVVMIVIILVYLFIGSPFPL